MARALPYNLRGKRDGWWILRLSGCWGEDSDHTLRGRGIPQVCRALDLCAANAECAARRPRPDPSQLRDTIRPNFKTACRVRVVVEACAEMLTARARRKGVMDARTSKIFSDAHA